MSSSKSFVLVSNISLFILCNPLFHVKQRNTGLGQPVFHVKHVPAVNLLLPRFVAPR
jgi:hypothetical protein